VWQLSDKPDCITQQERGIFKYHFAGNGIKPNKQFVLGKNFAFAQKGHQGASLPKGFGSGLCNESIVKLS
jgi:hypothetical protein